MARLIARFFRVGLRPGNHAELATMCAWMVAILADHMRLVIDRGHLIDELATKVDELAAARAENAALRHRVAMLEVPS